jgi:hypothetical protein
MRSAHVYLYIYTPEIKSMHADEMISSPIT